MEINITNRINQYEAAVCQLLYSKNLYAILKHGQAKCILLHLLQYLLKGHLKGAVVNEMIPAEKGIQGRCGSQNKHLPVMYETATLARGEWPSGITAEYSRGNSS